MRIIIAAIIVAAALVECTVVKFHECKDVTVLSNIAEGAVVVTPCDSQPCELHHGTNVTINISFTPSKDFSSLNTIIKGKIGPIWVPFPIDNNDACVNSGLTCPIRTGELAHFTLTLPIRSYYPDINVIVEIELKNDDGVAVCIDLPLKIVS
jgi:Niemann-Pick C2 protein